MSALLGRLAQPLLLLALLARLEHADAQAAASPPMACFGATHRFFDASSVVSGALVSDSGSGPVVDAWAGVLGGTATASAGRLTLSNWGWLGLMLLPGPLFADAGLMLSVWVLMSVPRLGTAVLWSFTDGSGANTLSVTLAHDGTGPDTVAAFMRRTQPPPRSR